MITQEEFESLMCDYDINEQEIASTSVTCNIYKNRRK